jgi:hypothetical protein
MTGIARGPPSGTDRGNRTSIPSDGAAAQTTSVGAASVLLIPTPYFNVVHLRRIWWVTKHPDEMPGSNDPVTL